MCAKSTDKQSADATATIARNKKARFEYEVLDKYEAGISLVGSEVKSLRNGDVSINEAFARPRGRELWLLNMNIKPYAQASIANHEPTRPRKLLLHKREIDRILAKVSEKGCTLVPLALYWKRGLAKVSLGLVRGKRQHDKRQSIRKRETDRDIQRAMRRQGR